MRLITAALIAAFITLFPIQTQAYGYLADQAICDTDTALHSYLISNGMFLFSYGMTDYGFMIATWVGTDSFVMTAEVEGTACILTQGVTLYQTTEHGI